MLPHTISVFAIESRVETKLVGVPLAECKFNHHIRYYRLDKQRPENNVFCCVLWYCQLFKDLHKFSRRPYPPAISACHIRLPYPPAISAARQWSDTEDSSPDSDEGGQPCLPAVPPVPDTLGPPRKILLSFSSNKAECFEQTKYGYVMNLKHSLHSW